MTRAALAALLVVFCHAGYSQATKLTFCRITVKEVQEKGGLFDPGKRERVDDQPQETRDRSDLASQDRANRSSRDI